MLTVVLNRPASLILLVMSVSTCGYICGAIWIKRTAPAQRVSARIESALQQKLIQLARSPRGAVFMSHELNSAENSQTTAPLVAGAAVHSEHMHGLPEGLTSGSAEAAEAMNAWTS